jgi:hypothetical protein
MNGTPRILLVCLILSVMSVSCTDYLDQVPNDRLTEKKAFSQEANVKDYLANIYSYIPYETQRFVGGGSSPSGPWTAGSDEAEYSYSSYFTNTVNQGAYDATTGFIDDWWSSFYRGIRSAGYFMKHVNECKACTRSQITRFRAEARGLRAIYYFYLMRSYGPVIIFKNGSISASADIQKAQIPRTPFDEGVKYVVNQLDSAAMHLPNIPSDVGDNYYGHLTKSVVMGYKIKMLLLAASPLFNGDTYYASMKNPDGTQLISQTEDDNKWKKAADAAKAFIQKYVPNVYKLYREDGNNGNYSPYLSCRNVVIKPWNRGIVYARPNSSVDQYVMTPYNNGAPDGYRGGGGLAATQEIVNAFFMANGRNIDDPKSGYKKTGFSQFQAPYDYEKRSTFNQWVGRGPRFYADITYNNSLWLDTDPTNFVTTTWYGGNSGKGVAGHDHPKTGYVVRKNVNPSGGETNNQTIPMLKLDEIYLDYVEALNEFDPGNPDILKYLNKIRIRAGIPGYGLGSDQVPAPSSKKAMRKAIHHERRVELAFENRRYFDVRRWKILNESEFGQIHGMDALASNEADFYHVIKIENRAHAKKYYLFPIPLSDINSDKKMVQNTGW